MRAVLAASASPGKPTVGPGVKAALVSRTKRADGSMQVTYNKHPLYTFALDKQAGQVNGEARLRLRSQVVRRLRLGWSGRQGARGHDADDHGGYDDRRRIPYP